MTYIFGDLGRCWSIFRDMGSKCKIFLGSRGNYFQGSGEINALFSGIKGAQTPPGGPQSCWCFRRRPQMVSKLPLRTPSTCSASRQFLRSGLH